MTAQKCLDKPPAAAKADPCNADAVANAIATTQRQEEAAKQKALLHRVTPLTEGTNLTTALRELPFLPLLPLLLLQ